MLRKFALGIAAAAAFAPAALAGGLYEPAGSLKDAPIYVPPHIWSGFYVGIHGGYADGEWDGKIGYSDAYKYPDGFDRKGKTNEADGWLGGLQVGYNVQRGSVVFGLEADVSWVDFEGDITLWPYPENKGSPAWEVRQELEWFGTVRGRLGFTVTPNLLLYATGGVAYGETEADLKVVYEGGLVNATGKADHDHVGWAAGLGGEWAIKPNIVLGAEWLHVDLGEEDYLLKGKTKGGAPHLTDSFPSELEFDVIRARLSYKFRP